VEQGSMLCNCVLWNEGWDKPWYLTTVALKVGILYDALSPSYSNHEEMGGGGKGPVDLFNVR